MGLGVMFNSQGKELLLRFVRSTALKEICPFAIDLHSNKQSINREEERDVQIAQKIPAEKFSSTGNHSSAIGNVPDRFHP